MDGWMESFANMVRGFYTGLLHCTSLHFTLLPRICILLSSCIIVIQIPSLSLLHCPVVSSTVPVVDAISTLFWRYQYVTMSLPPSSCSLCSIASTVTYPLQVIKARVQQRSKSLQLTSTGEVRLSRQKYVGFLSTTRQMWKAEGLGGFFKGCLTNAFRVAPGAAVTFVMYETVMDTLHTSKHLQ